MLNRQIFRAYDIRGIYPDNLNARTAEQIGQAIGSEALERDQHSICVGYDGRLSSPELSDALIRGLRRSGVDVVSIGEAPTPALYYAATTLCNGSGVMVTGSHNPKTYNGFKIMLGGHTLADTEIYDLYHRITAQQLSCRGNGQLNNEDISDAYLQRLLQDHKPARPLRVALDCGNGVAGPWMLKMLAQAGCEVLPLYCDVNGHFPNHHPDPEKPENLQDLISLVNESGADIGLALDGDGDRLAVICNEGEIISPDQLICLFAETLLKTHPGARIVHDVKCSLLLRQLIQQQGGDADMWKCGHSMQKNRIRETGAMFGGEFSGHLFFADQWYGFDDGLYAAVRLLDLVADSSQRVADIFQQYPLLPCTPIINLATSEDQKFALVEALSQQSFEEAEIFTMDGLRVEYSDGWFGLRASNTTPILTLRAEAQNETSLKRICADLEQRLLKIDPDLQIPELAVTNSPTQ